MTPASLRAASAVSIAFSRGTVKQADIAAIIDRETYLPELLDEMSRLQRIVGEEDNVYRSLTVQALHIRNEIFKNGGMNRKHFDVVYLCGLGKYERKVAKEEGIKL